MRAAVLAAAILAGTVLLGSPIARLTAQAGDAPNLSTSLARGRQLGGEALPKEVLLLGTYDRFEHGHEVAALQAATDSRLPIALWSQAPVEEVEEGVRVWGLPEDLPLFVGPADEVGLLQAAGVPSPCWLLIDESGHLRWTGPVDPTPEIALARLRALQDGTLEEDLSAAEAEALRQSTRSADRARYLALVDGLRDRDPSWAGSWIAEYRLLMQAVPQVAERERSCVQEAFDAMADRPLELSRFVHRSLHDEARFSDQLGPAHDALDALRARHLRVRGLEWGVFRAAVAARRPREANRSALRLVEHSKGRPMELLRAARELVAAALELDEPKLARWADLALGFASESVPQACGFERERYVVLLSGLGDRERAAESLRRFGLRAADLPSARADFVLACLEDELIRARADTEGLRALTDDFESCPAWPDPQLVRARAEVLTACGDAAAALALLEAQLEAVGDRASGWRRCRWLRDELRSR